MSYSKWTALLIITAAMIFMSISTLTTSGEAAPTTVTASEPVAEPDPVQEESAKAAWETKLLQVNEAALSTNTPVEASTPTALYVSPTEPRIYVRDRPSTEGRIIGSVLRTTPSLEVIEPYAEAIEKIGVSDQWIKVRTADGVEGYTAAWLYSAAGQPNTATQVSVPQVEASSSAPASVLALDGITTNSIMELNIVPVSDEVASLVIPPMNNSILGLDVDGSAGEVESVPENTTAVESPVDLVNNIVPITINVNNASDVQMAELSINGRQMALFDEAPYTYDLDAGLFDAGDYKLTFTTVHADGVVHAAELYFEVVVDETAQPAAAGEETALSAAETAVAPGAQRTLLLDGEARPFDFEFSTDQGLVLAAVEEPVEASANDDSRSLEEILGEPISGIIPQPVKEVLMTPRPTLAAVIILVMLLTLVPQGFFTLYWMTYTWNNPAVADEYRSPKEFIEPRYSFTALLPARHEPKVIKDTIRAVDRINYPDDMKEILVLVRDEDDAETISAVNEVIYEIGKPNIRLITFTDGPRNKPNGLNKGLRAATKEVVCVFDAEDEPHPDIYNVVNTVMVRDNSDVVQSGVQLMNFESSWFSALNVLEYFFWFKSGLHAFTREFHVTPLGGNTVFFKRPWLERINGWDDKCLTEDADVGLRLTQLGAKIQIVYDEQHATQEETPDTVDSFIKQRTRWNQGFYQIFFKGDWLKLPMLKQKVVALYILLNSLLQAANFVFIPLGAYIALTQEVSLPVALLSYIPIYILLIQMITNLIGIREFASAYGKKLPMFFTLRMIAAYYPYQLVLSVAAVRAIFRLVTQKQAWEKTAHSNLHRQGQLNEARL